MTKLHVAYNGPVQIVGNYFKSCNSPRIGEGIDGNTIGVSFWCRSAVVHDHVVRIETKLVMNGCDAELHIRLVAVAGSQRFFAIHTSVAKI